MQLSHIFLDYINHGTLKQQKGHYLSLCQDMFAPRQPKHVCSWNYLANLIQVHVYFELHWNYVLANFLSVLLVNLNPLLLYCCAITNTESFKNKQYIYSYFWMQKLSTFCMWNISCVKHSCSVFYPSFSILISTHYIQRIQADTYRMIVI